MCPWQGGHTPSASSSSSTAGTCQERRRVRNKRGHRDGLDTDTVELTVKTLLRRLVTRKFNSPTNSLRAPYFRVEP
eukprot:1727878-Pyramimonas_sp.AAC.1